MNEATVNLRCKGNHIRASATVMIVFTPHYHTLNSHASFWMLAQQVSPTCHFVAYYSSIFITKDITFYIVNPLLIYFL